MKKKNNKMTENEKKTAEGIIKTMVGSFFIGIVLIGLFVVVNIIADYIAFLISYPGMSNNQLLSGILLLVIVFILFKLSVAILTLISKIVISGIKDIKKNIK